MRPIFTCFALLILLPFQIYAQGSGNCLIFNGSQYITADGLLNNFSFSQLTVTAWVKPESTGPGAIFAFNENNGTWTNNVNLFYYNDNHFEYFDKNPNNFNIPTTGYFPPGHWYHVSLVIDQGMKGKVYVNGVQHLTFDAFELPSSGDRFSIGQEWDGYNESALFNGLIDELRVWNKALTEQEIRETMCKTIAPSQPDLKAYYRFDAASGSVLTNETGSNATGNLIGFAPGAWKVSGAPIGDESVFLYPGNWSNESLSIGIAADKYLSVSQIKNAPEGLHLYTVLSTPNSMSGISIPGATEYFGVFATDLTTQFDVEYGFAGYGNGCIDCDKTAAIFSRNDNAEPDWTNIGASIDAGTCTGSKQNESQVLNPYRGEYIMGFSPENFVSTWPPAQSFCEGDDLELSMEIPGASNYLWSTGETTSSILVSTEGAYWVQVQFPGCTFSDTIQIQSIPAPVFDLGENKELCEGSIAMIGPSLAGNYDFLWSNGATDPIIEVTSPGLYVLTVTGGSCSTSDSILIDFVPVPVAEIGNDTSFCLEQIVVLETAQQPGVNYVWNDGSTGNEIIIKETGVYSLKAFNACGQDSDQIEVTVEDCHKIYIPNVFSPNNDGINDDFSVIGGSDGLSIIDMKIFDRWGELVFERKNFLPGAGTGWDGTFKGKPMPSDVFVYLIVANYKDNKKETIAGDLTLLR